MDGVHGMNQYQNLKSDARTLKLEHEVRTRGSTLVARVLLSLFRAQPPRDHHRRQSCLEVTETTHFIPLDILFFDIQYR